MKTDTEMCRRIFHELVYSLAAEAEDGHLALHGPVRIDRFVIFVVNEIEYMINDSGAETVICMDTNFCYVQDIFHKTGLKRAIVTHLAELLPFWKRCLGTIFDKVPSGKVEWGPDVHTFRSLLKHPPLESKIEIDPRRDLSYILYTGGTTGFPKGFSANFQE